MSPGTPLTERERALKYSGHTRSTRRVPGPSSYLTLGLFRDGDLLGVVRGIAENALGWAKGLREQVELIYSNAHAKVPIYINRWA